MKTKRLKLSDLETRYADFCQYMATVNQNHVWRGDVNTEADTNA